MGWFAGCLVMLWLVFGTLVLGWNEAEKVLLREIQAITLYRDHYTASRRTTAVPQLKCTGGTAGCSAFVPEVVQCHNRGWDGFDVQWECKADMDTSYRFGRVEVSCEGFDYPADPFVLRGSCGLEYTIELTEQGQRKAKNSHDSSSFGSSFFQGHSSKVNSDISSDSSGLIIIVVLLVLAYGVYKIFLSDQQRQQSQQPSPGSTAYSHSDGHPHSSYTSPPPPGFKSDFTGASTGYEDFGSNNSSFGDFFTRPRHNANSGPGFWTGVGTGGVLGYLFGNRRSQPYCPPSFNTWTNPVYPSPMQGYSNAARPSESSGTRTASGFGGTKRR
ncbi:store-operated calcium entry-associated regulatory factor isoform X2 [Rhinatrema bivittatum]|uniref:store-operated calcium entry-associated regulatory factor isoform X2 n=1 Tax=Rhinatrema bivittatum TaxID=194408 RepID=UPI00112D381B|nr:store-operated calcium entry-associated regulatory factor isoform X2 [Rhinatrema bivittatum]XP_029457513.1 store-operated calcium entry-associated regulatory factor isoform X2 [Rhinatrema bivittatum]